MTVGILIIGSLLWDAKGCRPKWRADHLDLTNQHDVRVPIRYGRLSKSRDCTYTMVIDPNCEPGVAKVIGCKKVVINCDELLAEAHELWAAEVNAKIDDDVFWSTNKDNRWGCVAMLSREGIPGSKTMRSEWVRLVQRKGGYADCECNASENGVLSISWPEKVDGGPVEFDLILATVTQPTLHAQTGAYPDADTIAEAWRRSGKEACYFWMNRDYGIRTFQDEQIGRLLKTREGQTS